MPASAPAARMARACQSASASRRCGWTASRWAAPVERGRVLAMIDTVVRWAKAAAQIGFVIFLVLVAKGALAEPFYVPSGSMEPTLLIGDALVATKFPYGYGMASLPLPVSVRATPRIFGALPERGDVVVFRWPGDPSQTWVKRVIGLP